MVSELVELEAHHFRSLNLPSRFSLSANWRIPSIGLACQRASQMAMAGRASCEQWEFSLPFFRRITNPAERDIRLITQVPKRVTSFTHLVNSAEQKVFVVRILQLNTKRTLFILS
jgi:hypothetical protein